MSIEFICNDCPRKCSALRNESISEGICCSTSIPFITRAAPHFGEEPCISGTNGSGAVFFSGCNLRCVFCQNNQISRSGKIGKPLQREEFRSLLLRLRDTGVHNINLVTPTHHTRFIADALEGLDLGIPVVWNSSGYESVESLKMLDGLVQVYMPDFKYALSDPARKYSSAPDYPEIASAALAEMYHQRGKYVLDDRGMLLSGLLIRHLVLPGNSNNSMDTIDFIADSFEPGSVLFSLMGQYTPMADYPKFPELSKKLEENEYALPCHYLTVRKVFDGFTQEINAAGGEMIPDFDLTGL